MLLSQQIGIEYKLCKGYNQKLRRLSLLKKKKYIKISENKIEKGIFVGPRMKELTKDANFDLRRKMKLLLMRQAIKIVTTNNLGHQKGENYKQPVDELLQNYEDLQENKPISTSGLFSKQSC